MFNYKVILGLVAVIIAIVSYIPYFRDIFVGKTKPHLFTWLVWTLLSAIAFFGQIFNQGGAGAWVTGVIAIVSGIIFILAIFTGEKEITFSDKFSLLGVFLQCFFGIQHILL
jgi:hypothetical protein